MTSSFWLLIKIQTIYFISEKSKLLYLRFEWVQPSFRIWIFKIQKSASWTTRKVIFVLLIPRYNYKLNKICVWLLLFLLSQSTVISKWFFQSCFFSILYFFLQKSKSEIDSLAFLDWPMVLIAMKKFIWIYNRAIMTPPNGSDSCDRDLTIVTVNPNYESWIKELCEFDKEVDTESKTLFPSLKLEQMLAIK